MLKSLSISNYRGFYDEQKLEFGIPVNEKSGSGLTLIVGPNNTGKTTIIESLLLTKDKKFPETERHPGVSPKVMFETNSGNITEFTNIDDGSQIKREEPGHGLIFELVPARRFWPTYTSGHMHISNLPTASTQHAIRGSQGNSVDVASLLKDINKTPDLKNEFDEYLKIIIPNFTSWTIDSGDLGDYVKYKTFSATHKADLAGEGIISIFRICAHLISDSKKEILIIDEPELSLHPSAQKSLSRLLSKAASKRQIVISTHSPHFANWQDFINGAKFIRLNKHNDHQCEISILDNSKEYPRIINTHIEEWQRPQLLDYVAKEILFCDKILFTEGQEDVGLLKKWFCERGKEINFDIFGYGVGGYSNMEAFLTLAKDLGLSKVVALLDSGVGDIAKLQTINEQYNVMVLPTEDIRDKWDEKGEGLIKQGCFDKSGNLKSEHKSTFDTIMEGLISYFE